jgi:hypothetical protein
MARQPPRPAGGPDDAVVPNGAAPHHHDHATFATTERREATRLPTPNRELANPSWGKSAPATSGSGSVPQADSATGTLLPLSRNFAAKQQQVCRKTGSVSVCRSWGVERDTITLASTREQASVASPVRLSQWTTTRSATRPEPLHPVHGHDVGACKLPIAGNSSTVAVAMRPESSSAGLRLVASQKCCK